MFIQENINFTLKPKDEYRKENEKIYSISTGQTR